jgi:hypothetical protein
MYRWLTVFVVGCGLSPRIEVPPAEGGGIASYVDYKDIPASEWRHPIDLVFVIDTTPEMAPLRDKLVAQFAKLADVIEAEAVTMDLQIMVIDADVANAGASQVLHMLSLPAGGYVRSYTGTLSEQLTALVPTTFTATSSQPLAALVTALGTDQAFRHDGTQLMPIIISNHDDESPDAVATYFSRMRAFEGPPYEPVVGLIDATPSVRLEEFFNAQVASLDHASITDNDWSNVLLSFQIKTVLGAPCIDAVLAEPRQCSFSAILQAQETALPACDASATSRPCAALIADPTICVVGSGLYVKVNWLAWPEYETHVIGQCVANFPEN